MQKTSIIYSFFIIFAKIDFLALKSPQKHRTQSAYENLWQDFLNGNMTAFRQIYTDFYPGLYQFGRLYLDKAEVENAIQDMFLYILQRRDKLKKIDNLKAYLYTAFRHQLSKTAKKQLKTTLQMPELFTTEPNDRHYTEIIKKIIRKLSAREQEVIRLKYFDNYKNKEIAHKLNIEYQTVRNTLHNAIKKMRTYLLQVEFS